MTALVLSWAFLTSRAQLSQNRIKSFLCRETQSKEMDSILNIPPPPSSSGAKNPPPIEWIMIIGSLATVVGSFMSWATVSAGFIGSISKNGIDGDGKVVAVLGGIAGYLVVRKRENLGRKDVLLPAILNAVSFVVCLIDLLDIQNKAKDTTSGVLLQVGNGLWICLFGAGISLAAAIYKRFSQGKEKLVRYESSSD
jgi:hypothetical protein